MKKDARIYVAGHRGLVGSAISRRLKSEGYSHIIEASREELDLSDRQAVDAFIQKEQPEYVIIAAAKVGGIKANDEYPADFIYQNLSIQTNVIDASYQAGVKKLLFLGSSCIYPKLAPQPMTEDVLLTGALEPTNEWYAIAKIAGLKMCAAYKKQYGFNAISLMPTNLYGMNDNFDLETSHVLPALIRKAHEAKVNQDKQLSVWGTGEVRREFLHVDDLADAVLFAMLHYDGDVALNVGTGEDITIKELVSLICRVVGYQGELVFDTTKPDGTPRKLLDISRIKSLGWSPKVGLEEGVANTYEWYCNSGQALAVA